MINEKRFHRGTIVQWARTTSVEFSAMQNRNDLCAGSKNEDELKWATYSFIDGCVAASAVDLKAKGLTSQFAVDSAEALRPHFEKRLGRIAGAESTQQMLLEVMQQIEASKALPFALIESTEAGDPIVNYFEDFPQFAARLKDTGTGTFINVDALIAGILINAQIHGFELSDKVGKRMKVIGWLENEAKAEGRRYVPATKAVRLSQKRRARPTED
jgi:hypothetical protein